MANPASPGGVSFPPFDATWAPSTIFWLAITFGALYWLMSRRALPTIAATLEERASRIERDLAEATAMQAKAEAAAAAHDEALARARREAQGIAQAARDAIASESDRERKRIERELAQKLAAAETRIASLTASAMANVDSIAAETVAPLVEALGGKTPTAAEVAAAIRTVRS